MIYATLVFKNLTHDFYSSDVLYFSIKTCELGVKYILLQHVFPSAFGLMSKID